MNAYKRFKLKNIVQFRYVYNTSIFPHLGQLKFLSQIAYFLAPKLNRICYETVTLLMTC